MLKTIITTLLAVTAACMSAQPAIPGPVKSPAVMEKNTYGFDAGRGRTLRLSLDTRMASYSGLERATISLALENARNALYRKGVVDTRTLLPVTAMSKDAQTQTIYDWTGHDSLTRYVFDATDHDGQSCRVTRHESRYAIDVCNVLYRMYTLQHESSFCGLAVMDGGRLRDITRATITRKEDTYTYSIQMPHGYHITATFLNDSRHTPVSIDINLKDFRSSGMRTDKDRSERNTHGILARKTITNE